MSKVIVYGNWPVNTYMKIEYRNGQFWRGEIERGFDYFIADRPEIIEAYTNAGVTQIDTNANAVDENDFSENVVSEGGNEVETQQEEGPLGESVTTARVKEEETPVQEDIESLPWPTLKSRASKKAGYNVMTKQEALEVLKV